VTEQPYSELPYMQIPEMTAADFARLGAQLQARGRYPAAITCYRRAIALDRDNAVLWNRLGHALWRDRRYEDAEEAIKRAIALDPEDERVRAESRHWLGSVYADQGRIGEAIATYNDALELSPNSADVKLDRALTFLLGGQLRTGFREYEARIEHLKANYPDMPMPRWRGEDVMTKSVLVMAEQGIGDIIQFSRYLPWLAARCAEVIFLGPLELAPLFEPWPRHIIAQYVARGHWIPKADFYVPLCSLALLHNTSIEKVPGDPGYFGEARSRAVHVPQPAKPRLKIGICWAGNPMHGRDRDRSIALERFVELAADDSIQLYSFQVGQRAGDIDIVGAQPLIHDLSRHLTDWSATAGALWGMDIVISVDSAVAHLAGALGVRTLLLVSRSPDWRWGLKDCDTPWYPSMTIFRQEQIGDWVKPMSQIRSVLSLRAKWAGDRGRE
jgi:hypothetical protein